MKKIWLTIFVLLFLHVSTLSEAKEVQSFRPENDTWISRTAYDACLKYGQEYDISPELLMAIIEKESSGKPEVYNGKCQGLMQVSAKWHKDRMARLNCDNLFDEEQNIHVATDFLAELVEEYGDMRLVLMMYNMRKDTALENWRKGEITPYATEIIKRAEELEKIHSKFKG